MLFRHAVLAAAGLACAGPLVAADIRPVLLAEVQADALSQKNYTDGNSQTVQFISSGPDGKSYTAYNDNVIAGNVRAMLGAKVEIRNKVEMRIGFVYDSEAGDRSHVNADDRGANDAQNGGVFLNEAWMSVRDVFSSTGEGGIEIRAGRQPWKLNTRDGQTAFLYDSMANHPTVYGFDGLKASYKLDEFSFHPYAFVLNAGREKMGNRTSTVGETRRGNGADNYLGGCEVVWNPYKTDTNKDFQLSGSITFEANPTVMQATTGNNNRPIVARSLTNYGLAMVTRLNLSGATEPDFSFWIEGVQQSGTLEDGRKCDGRAISAGTLYYLGGDRFSVIGLQYDRLSGDHGDRTGKYNGFIANYEGVSDTLIVEDERYGELSELLVGDLQAFKETIEWRFDRVGTYSLKFTSAQYMRESSRANSLTTELHGEHANWFGQEFDLKANYKPTDWSNITLMGGVFLPGLGYRQAAADANPFSITLPDSTWRQVNPLIIRERNGPAFVNAINGLGDTNKDAGKDLVWFFGLSFHITLGL